MVEAVGFVSQRDNDLGSVAKKRLAMLDSEKRKKSTAEKRAEDTSGIIPIECKAIVEPDPIDEMTQGGMYKPQRVIEQEEMGQIEGRLIAVSEMAFFDWEGRKPKVGERVMFAKYAGLNTVGDDGRTYRVVNDKDIVAILPEVE